MKKTGNWVIYRHNPTTGEKEYFNPRGGFQIEFKASCHLFHDWRKVLWHLYTFSDPALAVEEVELKPIFTPVHVPLGELSKAIKEYGWAT